MSLFDNMWFSQIFNKTKTYGFYTKEIQFYLFSLKDAIKVMNDNKGNVKIDVIYEDENE